MLDTQSISNDTKIDVPLRIQRNKEFKLAFKLKNPNSGTYYDLSLHKFKLIIKDSDGVVIFTYGDNRFGKSDGGTKRELVISSVDTEQLSPEKTYYYDMLTIKPDNQNDYWIQGLVVVVNRITV